MVTNYVIYQISKNIQIEKYFIESISSLPSKLRATEHISEILSIIDTPIILLIDEADRLFEYKEISTEFFGMLRAWNDHQVSDNPLWKNFNMVLSYSSDVSLAIDNLNQSPFNTGLKMKLESFSLAEIKDLSIRHGIELKDEELKRFKSYIGGHPYLTRKVLYEMAKKKIGLEEALQIDNFDEHWRDRYLKTFKDNPNLIEVIKEIEKGNRPDTYDADILLSNGFIIKVKSKISFSCELYKDFFEQEFN